MVRVKDVKEALRRSKSTAGRSPTGERVKVGEWSVWATRVYSRGIGAAWYWHYFTRHPQDDYDTGGERHMGTLASMIVRRSKNFVPAKLERGDMESTQ